MEAQEFELVLNDLDTRVDRLRALYENWFRGYEKIEPQVARKDVERRVYALRKELPRNTALRFRYHQLYQRFTTLTNYWQRTARQIEEGTHRLQLLRMRRRMGGPRDEMDEQGREPRDDAPGPKSYELNLDESLSVDDLLSDMEMDEVARAVDTPGPHSEPPPPPRAPDLLKQPRAAATFARPKRGRSSAPAPRMRPMSESRASAPPPSQLEARPSAPPPAAPGPQIPAAAQSALTGGALPRPPGLPRATLAGAPPPLPGKPVAPPLPAPSAASVSNAKPAPTSGEVARPKPPGAVPTAPGLAPPRPPLPAPAAMAGRPPALPAAPHSGANLIPPERRAPIQSGGTMVGRPPPPPGMVAPYTPPTSAAAPNEQRMRRIYDEYAAARRRNNEGDVRYDALVTSIQKMLPELQKKHQGKQIDFEVVVKDGRVGLKPKTSP